MLATVGDTGLTDAIGFTSYYYSMSISIHLISLSRRAPDDPARQPEIAPLAPASRAHDLLCSSQRAIHHAQSAKCKSSSDENPTVPASNASACKQQHLTLDTCLYLNNHMPSFSLAWKGDPSIGVRVSLPL